MRGEERGERKRKRKSDDVIVRRERKERGILSLSLSIYIHDGGRKEKGEA